MKRPYTVQELGGGLCDYCLPTDRGEHAYVGTPNGPSMCEGRFCEDAYETYLEECEDDENMYEDDK